uniref:Uncharacterized protein n=1 Tax=Arundo donax TaxID=35708 RepID=A0A0A9FQK5_ARUDO
MLIILDLLYRVLRKILCANRQDFCTI